MNTASFGPRLKMLSTDCCLYIGICFALISFYGCSSQTATTKLDKRRLDGGKVSNDPSELKDDSTSSNDTTPPLVNREDTRPVASSSDSNNESELSNQSGTPPTLPPANSSTPSGCANAEGVQTVGLDQETPLGIKGGDLLADWVGIYRGDWSDPLGAFTVTISGSEGAKLRFRRYDCASCIQDVNDADVFGDCAVEIRIPVDISLSTANGAFQFQIQNVDAVSTNDRTRGSLNYHVVVYGFDIDSLDPAINAELSNQLGVNDTCSSSGHFVLARGELVDGMQSVFIIRGFSNPSENCRKFTTSDIIKTSLP